MQKTQATSRSNPARSRRGFTLIEVLVSIGAAALVAVGIASIFESVGKTVSGGKRISQFNAYAAMLEQQLRKDFSQMSRDGFLLIRQQYAGVTPGATVPYPPPTVALTADDTAPRARRVDELLFFATGEFTTSREPMHPAYVASANAARVYYGHGARMSPANPAYVKPEPYDRPNTGDRTWVLGMDGPNKYASDWTLLRHITLLSPPRTASSYPILPAPATIFSYQTSAARVADQPTQIALQPSAPSIFRQLNARVFPLPTPGGPAQVLINTIRGQAAAYTQNPNFYSGIVDITSTSLSELRSLITTLPEPPDYYTAAAKWDGGGRPIEGMAYEYPPDADGPLERQQRWMDQAWPTQSDPTLNAVPGVDPVPGARMRYENAPPDYLNVLSQTYTRDEEEQYRRIDQTMLSASNFVPRCTEFIVEWSFGQIDRVGNPNNNPNYGRVIWYGLDRRIDLNGDGAVDGPNDGFAARPYPFRPVEGTANPSPLQLAYLRADGKTTDGAGAGPLYELSGDRTQLINGFGITGEPDPTLPLTAYFGYVDPTFNPAGADGSLGTADDPAAPMKWVWPRMIRITVTIADAKDPKIEQTFQFVIETPENSAS